MFRKQRRASLVKLNSISLRQTPVKIARKVPRAKRSDSFTRLFCSRNNPHALFLRSSRFCFLCFFGFFAHNMYTQCLLRNTIREYEGSHGKNKVCRRYEMKVSLVVVYASRLRALRGYLRLYFARVRRFHKRRGFEFSVPHVYVYVCTRDYVFREKREFREIKFAKTFRGAETHERGLRGSTLRRSTGEVVRIYIARGCLCILTYFAVFIVNCLHAMRVTCVHTRATI